MDAKLKSGEAICRRSKPIIKDGEWAEEVTEFRVRVMAVVDGYAMVRRKGCMPFVCREQDLVKEWGIE